MATVKNPSNCVWHQGKAFWPKLMLKQGLPPVAVRQPVLVKFTCCTLCLFKNVCSPKVARYICLTFASFRRKTVEQAPIGTFHHSQFVTAEVVIPASTLLAFSALSDNCYGCCCKYSMFVFSALWANLFSKHFDANLINPITFVVATGKETN